MRYAPAFQVIFIAGQGILEELKTPASLYKFAGELQVHIGIGQHLILVMLGADCLIFLGDEDVALDTTAQRHLREGR